MRQTLSAALVGALTLMSVPAFADVVPGPDEIAAVALFGVFGAGVLVAAVWLVCRARRRR
jgi:hypothetical protein